MSAARPVLARGDESLLAATTAVVGVVAFTVVVVAWAEVAVVAAVVVGAGVTGIERTGGIVVVVWAATGAAAPTTRKVAINRVRSTRTAAR